MNQKRQITETMEKELKNEITILNSIHGIAYKYAYQSPRMEFHGIYSILCRQSKGDNCISIYKKLNEINNTEIKVLINPSETTDFDGIISNILKAETNRYFKRFCEKVEKEYKRTIEIDYIIEEINELKGCDIEQPSNMVITNRETAPCQREGHGPLSSNRIRRALMESI